VIERVIDKRLSTPAFARNTVAWAIKSAAASPVGSHYVLITAKVFTAFMFEGVVDRVAKGCVQSGTRRRKRKGGLRCLTSRLGKGIRQYGIF